MLRRTTLMMTVMLVITTCQVAQAQTSEYFMFSGDQATFSVVQGGVVLRTWGVAPGTAQFQYPLAIRDTIRTMGANAGDIGAEYDLFGKDLGVRYVHPPGPIRCWDGTTDGTYNYSIDTAGGVYRFDLDWSNPVFLFDAGSTGALAYDPTNDSLWVGQFSTTTVMNYTLTGTVLSSFATGHDKNMALALDHADDTLWLHDRNAQGTFEQWTKAGTRLARIAVPGMQGQNALAGEFQFAPSTGCPGDLNCDNLIKFDDIDLFVEALNTPGGVGWPHACPWINGDCNGDSQVNFDDIDPFVALIGTSCP